MATTRIALDSVLGTVSKTANTITSIVSVIDGVASMGNSFVQRHSIMQQDKNLVEGKVARIRLIEDTSLQIAERRKEISDRLTDPNFKSIYEVAYTEISGLFTPAE
jgi:hypothetical protein